MPTIEEIERDYPEEWLAVKVTEKDSTGEPVAGEILAESSDRDEIWDLVHGNTKDEIFIFFNGPPMKKGYVAAF